MTRIASPCWLLASALVAAPAMADALIAAAAPEAEIITVTGKAERTLTAPDAEAARTAIEQTPGGVALIEADQWRDTPARTFKDVLDFTPGVFAQPKWGEDTRLSIRGSGLSRNFHLRGVQLLVDGIPMNAADGSADFQEIDPTAFAYTEVYKGANALRYGSGALGGAINFVTASGVDARGATLRADVGGFGMTRTQLAAGTRSGAFDAQGSASYLDQQGFRDHASGFSMRATGNLGWRLTRDVETRLYLMGADLTQHIPGSLSRAQALHDPRAAAAGNLRLDYQRNMRSWRAGSKTTVRFDTVQLEFGGYQVDKQLVHPIFQFLDYEYQDHGLFVRALWTAHLLGRENRLTVGINAFDGHIDNQQFQNLAGAERGALLSASEDRSRNRALYAENALSLRTDLTLLLGAQTLHAERRRIDRLDDATDTSGEKVDSLFNPKLGLLWQASAQVQGFANVSRSGEPPSFGELNFTNTALADTRAQRATTYELGSRGEHGKLRWDVALYRAQLRHEFQFFDLGGGSYSVTNADRTVHQGVEAGLGWDLARSLWASGDRITLQLAYTFSDFYFDDDASWGRNELPGAPRHYLRAQARYAHASGWYLAPNLEWVPQGYDVDNANTTQTRAYAVLGLRAGYAPTERWSVYLDARNLVDRRYLASASVAAIATPASALYEPGDGRALYAGLRLNW